MTVRIEDKYPGRSIPSSTDYPTGSFKDESTPGMNDGTPLQVDWSNNREGMYQGLLASVGSEANGNVDTAVTNQVVEAILSNALGHTRPRGMSPESLCSGLQLAENIAFPNMSPNRSAYLTGLTPRDMCVAWDHTKDRPVLMLIDNNDIYPINCWDYSATPSLGTALTTSLTSPLYHAITSDGTALYVAYEASGTGNTRLAKFLLGTVSVPWTGTPVWDVDTGYVSTQNDALIIADADNIAILLSMSVTTSWQVVIATKAAGALSVGKGNDSGYEVNSEAVRIASNGDHVFLPAESGSNSYLLSASISNPSTSSYTAKFVTSGGNFTDVLALNSDTVIVCSIATASFESDLRVFHLSDDEFALVGNLTAPVSNQPADEFHPKLCFDGINVNVTHAVKGTVGSGKTTVIRPINATRFSPNTDVSGGIAAPMTALGCTNFAGDDAPLNRFVFDGRDLWMYFRDETDYSLFRIQAPGVRGI